MASSTKSQLSAFQAIPSVDQLLRTEAAARLRKVVGVQRLTDIARRITDEMRSDLERAEPGSHTREALINEAVKKLEKFRETEASAGLRRAPTSGRRW